MPINTENNKKTETVKTILMMLLLFLKKLEMSMERIDLNAFHGWTLSMYQKEINNLKVGIEILEGIQFKSVDDLDSVKRLRKAELWFLNNDVIKDFTFSEYKSQINSTFLTYVDIEIQLDAFDKKALDLLQRDYKSAGTEASWVVLTLRNLNEWYFQEKLIDYDTYRSKALEAINQSRPILEQYRGYKKLLGNLALLIFIGIPFIVNKAVNGHFLFFQKTNSSEQLDKLNQTVSQLSL